MNLSTFILDHIEPILQEWDAFARTIFPVDQIVKTKELRDHARQMLLVIADDLKHKQSSSEQTKKSKGLAPQHNTKETPAEKHGFSRLEQGFSLCEMVSEYRALRASVTKIFGNAGRKIQSSDINDLIRFNEAIDQALDEAVRKYTFSKEKQTRLFDSMLSTNPILSYILDLYGNFLYINQAMCNLYDKPVYEILGKAIYNFEMPSKADVHQHIKHIIKTGEQLNGEITFKKSSGKIRVFHYVYAPVFDENGIIDAIAGTSQDITEQKIAEEQSWRHANFDFLTGLANRLMFRDKLGQALKHSKRTKKPCALLFIDLDQFKNVNDTLGHDIGDVLLKQVARRINACVRETDTVARIGGDEFTVVLTDFKKSEQVMIAADKILSKLRSPFKIKKNTIQITSSIGIALYPKDGVKPETLLVNADKAMFASKKTGRDQFSFYKP
jgi:diguanylate cyclase (GGDEF)-like protein/PAS domain S-box-containing protein